MESAYNPVITRAKLLSLDFGKIPFMAAVGKVVYVDIAKPETSGNVRPHLAGGGVNDIREAEFDRAFPVP